MTSYLRIRRTVAVMIATAALATARAQTTFDNAVFYGAGASPASVAVGDLDGDQDNDLAVVDMGGHLQILFNNTLYLTWLFNTLWVGGLVVAITLVLGVPAAYSLARLTGRWGERLSIGIFLTYLIPSTLLFIPFSRLVALLGLQNQLWALVLIYPTFTVPFCTWLLMGFLKTLPKEIEESAMVDGCSRVGAITRVVLPLAVPGLLTVVIFALTLTIQEFVYSLTFISSVGRMTVSVGVPVALIRGDVYYWGSLMAACLITSVPLAILYNFFLDRFIAGFTVGAIK